MPDNKFNFISSKKYFQFFCEVIDNLARPLNPQKCKYWDIFWINGLLSATIEKRKFLSGVWRNW